MRPSSLLIFLLLAACCPQPPAPALPYPPARALTTGEALHLETGLILPLEQALELATDSRIVYVGEQHDNLAHHQLQLQVLQTLQARYPGKVALGMEMFSRSQQSLLEAWRQGQMDEKEFLRQSRWDEGWGFDWRLYRDLMLYARDRHIPVIGLNAEQELVNALRDNPATELSAELQARLPEMDLDDPWQGAATDEALSAHTMSEERRAGFHRVQTLWDETMADSIARYLDSPDGQGMHLLVIAGDGHIRQGYGIPRRVFRRLPLPYTLLGVSDNDIDLTLPAGPRPYDLLARIEPAALPPQGVMLGILLDVEAGGAAVKDVKPDTPAARAGMLAGDRIVRVNDEPVAEIFDLRYALRQLAPGSRARVTVERGGQIVALEVAFPERGQGH